MLINFLDPGCEIYDVLIKNELSKDIRTQIHNFTFCAFTASDIY